MNTSRSNSKPRAPAIKDPKIKLSKAPTSTPQLNKTVKPKVGQTSGQVEKIEKPKGSSIPAPESKISQLKKPSISNRSVSKERGASVEPSTRASRPSQPTKASVPNRALSYDRGTKSDLPTRPSRPTQLKKPSTSSTPAKKPVDTTKSKAQVPKLVGNTKSKAQVPIRNTTATLSKPNNINGTNKNTKSDTVTKSKNNNDKSRITSKTATKEKTNKPVKPTKSEESSDSSERPSTVNLSSRKGENLVIRNPDSIKANNETVLKTGSESREASNEVVFLDSEIDYEDDFEDYESDFEADDGDSDTDATDNTESEGDISKSDGSEESNASDAGKDTVSYSDTARYIEGTNAKPPAMHIKEKFIPTQLSFYETERSDGDSNLATPMTPMTVTPMTPTAPLITPITPSVSLFNFAQAEHSIIQKKTKTRGTELLELITLDKQTFNIYESPPAKYEAFIQIFGNSNHKQVFVQTDVLEDQSTQTEEINSLNKWTQKPAQGPRAVGDDLVISEDISQWKVHINGVKLNNFIMNASNLILKILDEESTEVIHKNLKSCDENVPFSLGYFELKSAVPELNSPVSQVCFSDGQPCYMLSLHGEHAIKNGSQEFYSKGMICIWDLKNQSRPEYILTPATVASKCCFNPGNPTIVFAGMLDGSVALWDLQESNSQHKKVQLSEPVVFRTPTYSTAAVQWETGHHSAIVAIETFIYQSTSSSHGIQSTFSSDNPFCSLLTLEELGILNIWTVVGTDSDLSGSDTDLGLAPGGKLKLLKSTSVLVNNILSPTLPPSLGIRSFSFKVEPNNPHNLFIGTDIGAVLHCTRQGHPAMPRMYEVNQENKSVHCITFSPHRIPYFATGCNDGTVYIYNVKSCKPVFKCSFGHVSIVSIKWSVIRPTLFFVLDNKSCIQVWDLFKSDTSPCYVGEFKDDVKDFCIISDMASNSHWLQYLVVCTVTGLIKVHKLVDNLTSVSHDDYDFMRNLMNDL